MKSLIHVVVVMIMVFTASIATACVHEKELEEALNLKFNSTEVGEVFCPLVLRWFNEGLCKDSRREAILKGKVNRYLREYSQICLNS